MPFRATVWGLPDALSVTLTLALFPPVEVGCNFTPKKQEWPMSIVPVPNEHAGDPVVGATKAKSALLAPVSMIEVIRNMAMPELLSSTLAVVEVPMFTLPNGTTAGENVTAGAAAAAVTENPFDKAALWLSGLVTVTSRVPTAALELI